MGNFHQNRREFRPPVVVCNPGYSVPKPLRFYRGWELLNLRANRGKNRVILVEKVFLFSELKKLGRKNVVAITADSITPDHINMLSKAISSIGKLTLVIDSSNTRIKGLVEIVQSLDVYTKVINLEEWPQGNGGKLSKNEIRYRLRRLCFSGMIA